MKIPCISCNSIFRLESSFINPTGSLVRCPKCRFIFIVKPQELDEQPKTQDTKIDQSILSDLFKMEHAAKDELPFDVITEEWNSFFAQGVLTINDFDEEVSKKLDQNTVNADCTALPDLTDYENMIDWNDNTSSGGTSAVKPQD